MQFSRYDVWRYAEFYRPSIPASAQLSLGEGWTPAVELPALARRVGLDRLVLKREDLNPTGSHKARGLAYQVAGELASSGRPEWLVISSSGNAALAAAAYCRLVEQGLLAFVSPQTAPEKVGRLQRLGAVVICTERAIGLAVDVAERGSLPNLRPSTHPHGPEGFQSIAWELLETTAPVDALFTFVASASSLVGIGRGFERGAEVVRQPWRPALHAVQGPAACPVAGEFDPAGAAEEGGRLGLLGARKTRRVGEAKRLIAGTGGSGWVVGDEQALAASRLLEKHGVETSLEGAAAVAAAGRAATERGVRSAVVVLTGRPTSAQMEMGRPRTENCPYHAERVDQVEDILSALADERCAQRGR